MTVHTFSTLKQTSLLDFFIEVLLTGYISSKFDLSWINDEKKYFGTEDVRTLTLIAFCHKGVSVTKPCSDLSLRSSVM